MYDIILAFITSFSLTYMVIPAIIRIAINKNLFDEPNERKSHRIRTPSLGGIAIFAGVLFAMLFWSSQTAFAQMQFFFCSFIILFLIGAKDDIEPIAPLKKLLGQILAAGILVIKSNVLITSLYGIFGVYELPYAVSVLFTIFTIIVIINSFNLIDGINGLTACIGILISSTLGIWFLLVGHLELSITAFALVGSLLAFLRFNITPARIFMGDTGSLLVGLISSILIISFIELHREIPNSVYAFKSAPAIAIGILILPLFDTLRVFIVRISKGKSPMYPDRAHIHHLLLDYGLNHMQATGVLVLTNILFIVFVVTFQDLGSLTLIFIMLIVSTFLAQWLYKAVQNKSRSEFIRTKNTHLVR
ncbi:MAG: undecaprenyl/decaprenyl-phosphate alpha-N-acetylglucosaminyl 1-phosphate transferase [Saprospiraceae bacterium]|nr:undecaprenyl/decaprenyl-phosphate alpha-N-acetylglucosaminyl 1-phosphate transferase [Saprospiraceae bacterium]